MEQKTFVHVQWGGNETMKDFEKEYEKRLIEEFKEGNRERFDELVVAYTPKLLRFACGLLGNTSDAQEVVQDAFVRAYKGLDNFRGDSSFSTWMHRITMNLARNRFHYNACRGESAKVSLSQWQFPDDGDAGKRELAAEWDIPDYSSAPDRLLEKKELEKNVLAGIKLLPESLRGAMLLRHVKDMPYEEIASILECKIGTVKSRIARGRELLREYLHKADSCRNEDIQSRGKTRE